ncbi:hypothetical protein LTR10_001357 [Elasticomyces elasticus]|nr:hypothetical protein LTR10_001357 [Elasticomyces elasticus]KAK4965279.1 hypothetical protein LTR42_012033 [Elasticomyces elasticus]
MGAWGLGLFQSDDDFDIVDDLSEEAGFPQRITGKQGNHIIGLKTTANGKKFVCHLSDDLAKNRLSIYADNNKSQATKVAIREHLDGGKLQELIDKYTTKYHAKEEEAFPAPESGYILCILGACAMTLGCKLPASFKAELRALYPAVFHLSEAQDQLKKALDGPGGFQDGTPYDFGSVGLQELMTSKKADAECKRGIFGMNVGGQFTLFAPKPPPADLGVKARVKMELITEEGKHPRDACGQCGKSTTEDGKAMLVCSRCKERKYCSKECQVAHWPLHKAAGSGVCQPKYWFAQ